MLEPPPVRYATSGTAKIAYQVVGDGPVDLVVISGPASHLDLEWEEPGTARVFEQLASFARVVRFDRRGTGLSDAVERPPTLEQQMDDLRAVLGAVGLERVALYGASDAGLAALFTATFPERVAALVLWGVTARGSDLMSADRLPFYLDALERYGEGSLLEAYAPSRVGDARFARWWARYQRGAASPGMARRILELVVQTDITDILPTIGVPTLVLHRTDDAVAPVEHGRDLAARIPGARFLELPGTDNYGWAHEDPILDAIEEFLTGSRGRREADRVLATVLFTDIVGSTDRAARLGDRRWRELLVRHDAQVRDAVDRAGGRHVKSIGDGALAVFDGPARAVRCAASILADAQGLALELRAGVHAGECERMGDDVGGIAVHIAARVAALAAPGEVLVSSTVKDLVVGSGLAFAARGAHRLKGVPDEWHLFALERAAA